MKSFLNILLLFLVMGYSMETAYAIPTVHSDMEMECCEKPAADHSCCDNHDSSDNQCSDSGCCDCVMITNVLDFTNHKQADFSITLHFVQAEFPLITSTFKSPVFPIWSPPDIA